MAPHKLPNNSENALFATLSDIFGTQSHKFNLQLLTSGDALITVKGFIEVVLGFLGHLLPVHNAWLNHIHNLEQDKSILDLFVEIVDKDILNAQ